MQAVILAAGKSSRFEPFREFAHKSLVSIMGKTILEHVLESVKKSGITDVIIVTSENSPIPNQFGNGEDMGLKISYVEHKNAQGMGAALLDAEGLIKDDFFLLNAYHIDFFQFAKDMQKLQKEESLVLLGKKDIGSDYGYIQVDKRQVLGVIEKPQVHEDSMLRIIGIYLLNKNFLKTLKQTPLEHYHFEKALDSFAKHHDVFFLQTDKTTVTLKYPSDLLMLKNYLLDSLEKSFISRKATIAKTAHIEGKVYIGDEAKIMDWAIVKGPCYIGKSVIIGSFALVRQGADIEEGAVVGARMEIKNSLIMQGTTTHSGFIGDSIIGKNTKIAALMCTANARLDRNPVTLLIKGEKVSTGLRHFGVLIGNNTNLGIRVSTMPGVVIGNNSIIGPATVVMKNVPDDTKYFTKFQEVVEENNG